MRFIFAEILLHNPKFKFDDASLVKFNAEFDEPIGKFQAYRFRYPSV